MKPGDLYILDELFVPPKIACVVMLLTGLVYFFLSVFIDYWKSHSFRKADLKEPSTTPPYLISDEDVII